MSGFESGRRRWGAAHSLRWHPPRRKVIVNPDGKPQRSGEYWTDAREYARHRRALEILDKADYTEAEYAKALEQARKEKEARR
jgi:hypothetical protein